MINLGFTGAILLAGILIGYLFFSSRKKENKTEKIPEHSEPQETQSEGGASLLEKKMMLEDTITIIKRLSESASMIMDINELAAEIVKTACGILNVEVCVLFLLEEETDTLKVIASSGLEDAVVKRMFIKNGEEISGAVAKYNEAKIFNDFEKETLPYNLKQETCYRQSFASLPLSFKNKALGVLNVSARKSGRGFSDTDVEILKIIALETAISLQNSKFFQEQQKIYLDTIIALAKAIDARDPYTYCHSNNVTRYAVRIAQELGLAEHKIKDIRHAGLLHDIGKIGIQDSILMKPGKLSEDEYKQIKQHSLKGEEIVKSLPFLKGIANLIKHHHERFDGKGYPDGIRGEDIDVGARILAIADSFDAMTTKRVYRDPMPLDKAREELVKNKSTQFDPKLTDCFIRILEKEPNIIN